MHRSLDSLLVRHRSPGTLAAPFGGLVLWAALSACGGGGGGGSGGGGGGGGGGDELDPGRTPDPGACTFELSPAFGTPADGRAEVEIVVRLVNMLGKPMPGWQVELEVSGYANRFSPLPRTDALGFTRGALRSDAGERKELLARITSGKRQTELGPLHTVFLRIPENTWFVRASQGSDAASGRTPLAAWRSLEHALATVPPGATIHVGAGTYSGGLSIGHVSSAGAPLVLRADLRGEFTGDPGEVWIDAGGGPTACELRGADEVVLHGLALRGALGNGLSIVDSQRVSVLDCRLIENGVGLAIEGARQLALEGCRISQNSADGVRLAGALDARIANNLIYANGGSGLLCQEPSTDTSVLFNTFYANGGDQLREELAGGTGRIEDNVFAQGSAACLALAPGSFFVALRNLTWNNAERVSPRGDEGTIEADPLLADPYGPDGILGGVGDWDDDFRALEGSGMLEQSSASARAVVLSSGEALATFGNRATRALDGSAGDLAPANLGFHYRGTLDDFRSLPHGGGRLCHGQPGEVDLVLRAFDRELGLASPLRAQAFDQELLGLEQRVSPRNRPEELVAGLADAGETALLFVRAWDGWRWSEPFESPFSQAILPADAGERAFDLEYEQASGRALLVRTAGDTDPLYQVLADGRWSPAARAFGAPFGSGRLLWIELEPRPGSDEIALVALDDERDLLVSVWDGAGWSSPYLLEPSTVHARGWRPFDVAWESQSGDLLVTWGFNTFIEETRWAVRESASGTWRSGQHPSTDAVGGHILLSSDPGSDRIAALMGEGDLDNDVIVSVWNGAAWVDTAELTLAGPPATQALELCWFGTTGQAFALFRRQGHTGSFNCAILRPAGWRIQPDVVLPGAGRALRLRLESLPAEDRLLGMMLDEGGRLFGLRYDGVRFALLQGGLPLATGLDPAGRGRSFDLALRKP